MPGKTVDSISAFPRSPASAFARSLAAHLDHVQRYTASCELVILALNHRVPHDKSTPRDRALGIVGNNGAGFAVHLVVQLSNVWGGVVLLLGIQDCLNELVLIVPDTDSAFPICPHVLVGDTGEALRDKRDRVQALITLGAVCGGVDHIASQGMRAKRGEHFGGNFIGE